MRLLPFAAAAEDVDTAGQGPGRPLVPTPPRSPTAFGSHAGHAQARSEHRMCPRLRDAPHGASAGSSYVCPVDDAAESFVVGVVVAPDDVPADHAGLFFMAGMVGAVQCEVPERRELRFYAV